MLYHIRNYLLFGPGPISVVTMKIISFPSTEVDRDSSVGIATRYSLDGPEIESQWRRDFPRLFRPALRPTQLPVQWVKGLSWG